MDIQDLLLPFCLWYGRGCLLKHLYLNHVYFGEQKASIIGAGVLVCPPSSWARIKETQGTLPMLIPSALKRAVGRAKPSPLSAHSVVGIDLSEIGKGSL